MTLTDQAHARGSPAKVRRVWALVRKETYQIGVPIHWGYVGIKEDAGKTSRMPANLLSPTVTDPNAYTPEFKGFLVKVEKA